MTTNSTLSPNITHLWHIPLHDNLHLSHYYALLSTDERQKAASFHFKKHQNQYILARGALRHILSRYFNTNPNKIKFDYTEYQKPYIPYNPNHIQFNLSHSYHFAALGVTIKHIIGIDIEYIKPLEDMDTIAQQFFAKNEYYKFSSLNDSEKLEAFYTIWTRKEAFIKAIGEGLSHPLDTFDVTFLKNEPTKILNINHSSQEANKWSLSSFPFYHKNDKYIISSAIKNKKQEIIRHHYNFSTL